MAREPGYRLHKPSGQAYVNLSGKVYYLGAHGSPESHEKYTRLKAEWLLNRQAGKFRARSSGPTMAQVCILYLDFAEVYYRDSSEYVNLKLAINPVSELYSTLPAAQFGVVQYRAIRQWWLDREIKSKDDKKEPRRCSRQYINKQMKRLLRVIKWGVGEGMLPPSVHDAIRCVAPLKRGRTTAPEAKPITFVEQVLVDATLPHLTHVVADMVRFQRLTGCRPGEVCKITPNMVSREGKVWAIALTEHKTAYRGKARTIYVGPRAQNVLRPYLLRGSDEHCFSPIESEKQRRAAAHEARVTPLSCGNRPGTNRIERKPQKAPGHFFTSSSYAKSIANACKRAQLQHWAPNQLRHWTATAIRREFGIDAASIILGHSELSTTQIYAEADHAKAIEIASKIG